MIDLRPFCYAGEDRPYLEKPFTRGDYTYATNGHILVRVPKIKGAATQTVVDPEKVFPARPELLSPANFHLPPSTEESCGSCYRGKEHSCPSCTCMCEDCHGTGAVSTDGSRFVSLRGARFSLKYVRQIAALPALELPVTTSKSAAMYFRFDGGEGCLMPCKWNSATDDAMAAEPNHNDHAAVGDAA